MATNKKRPRRAAAAATAPSQSVLTIDLAAIAANYQTLRGRLSGATCAAVVKADAYGLGAAAVVPALAAVGCREFFVAQLGEAVAIRRVLPPAAVIYVLHGVLAGEATAFRRFGFVPVLNDVGQVEHWAAAARAAHRRLPAILHIDTGMSRLGLSAADARHLADDPSRLAGLDLRYVMTHLACADDEPHPLNAAQLAAFQGVRRLFPRLPASVANSSGIFLGPDYHFDLVRPGAALYGVNPQPGRPNGLRQAARLEGKILQIHEVDPPKTVGYGATHRVAARTRIATVAVGYADGWPRNLGNRGSAYIGDVRVPIIGRVSMDLMTLDITAAPAKTAAGDMAELMSERLPVDDVATAAGTIGYEILTRLGKRYHRTYVGGASVR